MPVESESARPDLNELRIARTSSRGRPDLPRRRRWPRLAALAAALLLAAAGGWLWLSRPPAVTVETVGLVSPVQALSVLDATGYVVAQRQVAVASKGTGRLAYLGIEEGQTVKTGQVLARLENDDLVAARDEARARLAAARAAVGQAEAELVDARRNHGRIQTLRQREVSPQGDLDAAETRLQKAQAGREAARRNVDLAAAGLRAAQAALDYTFIKAPFDALVLSKDADIGEVVAPFGSAANAKAAVATLADMSSLMVEADVTEANIGKVKVGQPCQVVLDALSDAPQDGVVHVIKPTSDRAKGTIIVKVAFVNRDPRVMPEMAARVSFLSRPLQLGEQRPLLGVSRAAVVRNNGGTPLVFTLIEGRAKPVRVTLGRDLEGRVEVVKGLKNGQQVIINPPPGLKAGGRVRVKKP